MAHKSLSSGRGASTTFAQGRSRRISPPAPRLAGGCRQASCARTRHTSP
ncbi:hypothetical protein HMPREF1868_00413 [Olsenella sp. DNF00959]|nr:hypothetical protein HMPREF1868_00413 [Olsenella sp. DNF00959]